MTTHARNTTFSQIKPRLLDMLRISDGGNVDNIGLDLLNRAQQFLWGHTEWNALRKSASLTVDPVTYLATLPADFGRLINLMWDSNGDGIPEGYFDIGGTDPARFCELRETFDKATGLSFSVYFGRVPSWIPIVRYIANLDDFEETDSNGNSLTEYSFFPAELLLKTAEKLHLEEKGSDTTTLNSVSQAWIGLLTQFEQWQNRGSAQDFAMRDAMGNQIWQRSYELNGSDSIGGGIRNGGYSNDTAWVGA